MANYGFSITVQGNAVTKIEAINSALSNMQSSAQKTDSVFGGLFKFEALKMGLNLLKTGASEIYTFGKQMEQTMLSFEVMTGSKDKAAALQKELKRLADISPMVDAAIYGGGKMLLNYGIEADKVGGYLNMLGDISAGDADRFQRLAYVFGQVSAQTRLQGADLRQMVDAGFNPLNEMVKTTGKSYEQLKDDMSKGKISFDMVVSAMKSVTGEGGRFNNMMKRQAMTVGGMESTFTGAMQSGMFGLFQRMSPMLKEIFAESTKIANSFALWITPKQSEILGNQQVEMNSLLTALQDSNVPLEVRKNLMEEINTKYGDYLPNLITEKTSVAELAIIQNSANNEFFRKITLAAQEETLAKEKVKLQNLQVAMQQSLLQKSTAQAEVDKMIKEGVSGAEEDVYMAQRQKVLGDWTVDFNTKLKAYNDQKKVLNDKISALTGTTAQGFDFNKLLGEKGIQGAFESINNDLKAASEKNKSVNFNKSIKTPLSNMNDTLIENAQSTANMTTNGGLGQAKVINMNFNQPLMQINAGTIDGQDMAGDATKVVEMITRELHNIAYEQGIM